MKKTTIFIIILFTTFLNAIQAQSESASAEKDATYTSELDSIRDKLVNQISFQRLQHYVKVLAADSMKGRETGTKGLEKARDFIVDTYIDSYKLNVQPEDLLQNFTMNGNPTENILLTLQGSEYPNEVIVLSAHYDHVGEREGKIYNGADDNASGSAALLEMARLFSISIRLGYPPKRTIVFAHFTAEELGLWGSKVFVDNTLIPYSQFYANLNMDMIGRVDFKHRFKNEYVYIVGSDYFGTELDDWLHEVNDQTTQLQLEYRYNSQNDPERLFQRTDSFSFSQKGIPFIFFTSGMHDDYHQPSDSAEKINYEMLYKRTQLIFALAWELANRDEKFETHPKKIKKYIKNYSQQ